jgi:hypothetical protein
MLLSVFLHLVFFFQVSSQLELWAEELSHMEMVTDGTKAEQLLQMHNESVLHMQNCTFEVLQRGQELCQVIDCFLKDNVLFVVGGGLYLPQTLWPALGLDPKCTFSVLAQCVYVVTFLVVPSA